MARSEARIQVRIWSDPDFRTLSPGAQWTYMFLLSQPDLAHDGVLPLRERRWAQHADGLTVDKISTDLAELAKARYVIVDERTEEVLIRTLIRGDDVHRQPNLLRAAAAHLATVQSPAIRTEIAEELRRILTDHASELSVHAYPPLRKMLKELGEPIPEALAEPQVNPTGKGSPNPSVKTSVKGSAKGSLKGSGEAMGVRGKGSTSLTLVGSHYSSETAEPSSDPPPKPKPDPGIRPDVDEICVYLADAIEANGSRRPTITKGWRTEARLLLDKDKRTVEQVKHAIDWCQRDSFWRTNVLSMPKLREQYDKLRLAAQRPSGAKRPPDRTSSSASWWDN